MADVQKQLPIKQYEYVDVVFGAAATDTPVRYTTLRPDALDDVRWLDVTQNAVYSGGSDQVPTIYRSAAPSKLADGPGYVMLRSSVANYQTRLLLFVED